MRIALISLLFCCTAVDAAVHAYFRDPDIQGDVMVFTAEGDLWLTGAEGGDARRLTTHPAEERQGRISPDSQQVAFVAAYEDQAQVYLIPVAGGVARQLTFETGALKLHGWTPDGKVLYSTDGRIGAIMSYQLRTVDPETLENAAIPLADAVEGDVDAQGRYLYFVQFGMQVTGDSVRAYRGGARGILWRFRLGSNQEAERLLADHPGSIRRPMVDGDTLYFISDASGAENLWSVKLAGGEARQLTDHRDWSIRGIDIDAGRAVYQLGADLLRRDLRSGESTTLPLRLTSDFPALRQRWLNTPLEFATAFRLSGKGDRLAITARGRAALASTDKTRLAEVNIPAQTRLRQATPGPDGEWVYGLSDISGEVELWRFAADGSERREQLTIDGDNFRWNFALSPDGNWIAHADNHGELWLLDIRSGDNRRIIDDGAGVGPFEHLVWSADSKLLAISYVRRNEDREQLLLYSTDRNQFQVLTSGRFRSYAPAFSPDGRWLYFLSDRQFTPFPNNPWGDRNMGAAFDRRGLIFAYALTADARFPFADANELSPAEEGAEGDDKADTREDPANIDWEGIGDRLWQVPLPAGNYSGLRANAEHLYVLDLQRGPDAVPDLRAIPIEPEPEPELFAEQVQAFALSSDGKKMFVRQKDDKHGRLFIVDAGGKFPEDSSKAQVQTGAWQLQIDPREEWRQMFHDAWLMHREQFFDPNMRGLDWPEVKRKYEPLLERLADRRDLDDVLAQMMGELGALHSSVGRGDYRKDEHAARHASLGAEYRQGRRGVTIARIFRFDPELPDTAPPLAKPGVDAREGDRLVAVNGRAVNSEAEVFEALENQVGKQVLLELERGNETRATVVLPVDGKADRKLRYADWVIRKRDRVSEANPEIGYLHLYGMGRADLSSFARDFYVSNRKSGLIIDVRRNGGGNVDSMIVEKLMRRVWSFFSSRPPGRAVFNQQGAFRGHLVVLADQLTYSDGETFAAAVQALGLATVIGKQTAGAGVWLRGLNSLSDKGRARVAEFPVYAADGRWINEGVGVAPTIEVDNPPHASFEGEDAQLQAAINFLERKIREQPVPPLLPRPFPPGTAPADEPLGR